MPQPPYLEPAMEPGGGGRVGSGLGPSTPRFCAPLTRPLGPTRTTLKRSRRQTLPIPIRTILLGIFVGGSFLAFRWSTPFGNMTVSRACIVLALIGMSVGLLRTPKVSASVRPALASALAVLLVVTAGLLYSPAPSTGLVAVGNTAEALLILFVSLFLGQGVLRHSSNSRLMASELARVPMWGYLPTGLLGIYQAFQLLAGHRPTIPLLSFARLDGDTLNSARTAFGSGLNEFNLDRVAAATGDPATYGIFSAMTIGYCLWAKRAKLTRADALFRTVTLLAFAGVILSASISAFLVLAVVLLCNIPEGLKGWRRLVAVQSLMVAALLALFHLLPAAQGFLLSAPDRVASEVSGQGSAGAHLTLLSSAWEFFGSHPFLGVGTGGLMYNLYGYDVGFSSVHNTLLIALAEGGVVLGAALFFFWLSLWRRLVPRPVLLALTAALILYLDFNRLPALWAITGTSAALYWWQRRSSVSTSDGAVTTGVYEPTPLNSGL